MWDNANPPLIQPDATAENQSNSNSVVVTNKGKSGNKGKIIAALLGVLILVAGVAVGLVLVNQQQLVNQKAANIAGSCRAVGTSASCSPVSGVGSSITFPADDARCSSLAIDQCNTISF